MNMKSKLSKDVEIPESFLFLNYSQKCLPAYITHIVILNYPKKHKGNRDNSETGGEKNKQVSNTENTQGQEPWVSEYHLERPQR